jgi:HD-GYP domain-containing protein (c-di-GMP phosphodiesterase class II)
MRVVALNEHAVGKRLAKTVFSADGRILLKTGVVLTAAYVRNLREKGYSSVYIENELVPGLEVSDAINEVTRVRATTIIKSTLERARTNQSIDCARIAGVVDDILADLESNSEFVFELSTLRSVDDYSFVHSVNVCVLSLILGQSLHLRASTLKTLGVGAILHDIGKVTIPAEVLNYPGRLSPEEFELIKGHTTQGFEILRANREISLLSAHVALQHHERLDGTGYPRQLRGDEILEYGRVAAIADVYDALTADRPYRTQYAPEEAVQKLVAGIDQAFDGQMVRKFLEVVAVYAVGSILRLSTGEIAVVVRQQRGMPSRPLVAVVTDPLYNLVEPWQLALADQPGVSVSAVLSDYPLKVKEQLLSRRR